MTRPDFARLVDEARPEELPDLAGVFEAARARVWARMTARTPEGTTTVDDRLLTMPGVAERLGITEHQAREMGRRGELPIVTVGERFVRVRTGALDGWIRRRETGRTMRERGGR